MEEVVPVTNAIKGCPTRWLRDEATGLVTNKVYADGNGPRYAYTPDGKLATRTWARGIVTTYSYDDNGALTNTVYSDGTPTISLAYNREILGDSPRFGADDLFAGRLRFLGGCGIIRPK